jgi:transcriptional regulator with XRE-family HTH domain
MTRKKPVTDEAIGARIRARREKIGMSQPELGEVIDVGPMQVSKYESGQSSITLVKLVKIAEALKCKTLDLIP